MVDFVKTAIESQKKGQRPPKITVTKKVKVPEASPRFIQYHVRYDSELTEHVVVFPINMFKDDKEAIEHISLMELYRRSRKIQ